MKLKMKFSGVVLGALLLTNCGSTSLPKGETELINRSALYDPPTVTLLEGQSYQFGEGVLVGAGQKFHSHYSYLRALTVGE